MLYLVDGYSLIYRAFYAYPPLSNSAGLPTNATYGFLLMILKLLKEQLPEYLLVVFDTGRDTWRRELYPEYKSHRSDPSPDLVPQFMSIRRVLRGLCVPTLELRGFEADDVIATLCSRFTDIPIAIVTSDKDFMQLVNDRVRIFDPNKGLLGISQVEEKFGVPPSLVTEVMALMGDSSDNVPGVRKVGIKTASDLIRKYHSLEEVYSHLTLLPVTLANHLIEDREMAFLSRKLVTLRRDLPLQITLDQLKRPSTFDIKGLQSTFAELEFNVDALVSDLSHPSTS